MKHILFASTILLISWITNAQTSFQNGNIINETGEKIECFIKNSDWEKSPKKIKYKLKQSDETLIKETKDLKSFEIYQKCKFINQKVMVDLSSDDVNSLSSNPQPNLINKKLLLKVILDGKASLYSYKSSNTTKFFYQKGPSNIEQLIFKKFLTSNNIVSENKGFKNQLYKNLICNNENSISIQDLEYEVDPLIAYFIQYNKCIDSNYKEYSSTKNKTNFNLNVRLGFSPTAFTFQDTFTKETAQLDNETQYNFGLELEAILPFRNNKWSIFIEPLLQRHRSEGKIDENEIKIKTKDFILPLGVRHYFHVNEKTKLFLNGGIVFNSNKVNFKYPPFEEDTINMRDANTWFFGTGVTHKKLNVEFRLFSARDFNYFTQTLKINDQKKVEFALSYTLF